MNAKGLPSQRATARRWQLAATAVVAALAIAGCKRADENKPAETQAPAAPAAQAPAPAPAAPPPVT
jgi:arylsulfatase